jgi:hypothetical protein
MKKLRPYKHEIRWLADRGKHGRKNKQILVQHANNIGAFCLRMRENRSVWLQMVDFKGFVSFVIVFMKNMAWIFIQSLRIRVNPTLDFPQVSLRGFW